MLCPSFLNYSILLLQHETILKEKEVLSYGLEKQLAERNDELLQLKSSHAASVAYVNMIKPEGDGNASQTNQVCSPLLYRSVPFTHASHVAGLAQVANGSRTREDSRGAS